MQAIDEGASLYHTARAVMYPERQEFRLPRGDDAPSPDRPADWVGEAVFNGHVAVWSWPAAQVRTLLAPGLQLAPLPALPGLAFADGNHPVLFVHGEQTRGANFFAGIPIRSGLAYHEAGILIPFVRHAGRAETLTTVVPRMYADFFPPVWHDEAYYGLGKKLVRFATEGPLHLCLSDERLLLEVRAEPRGAWQPAVAANDATLALVRATAGLPIVGRMADGSFVGSHFCWDFRPARVRPADSLVVLHAGALEPVRGRDCPDVAGGTIEVAGMIWRLGWPGRHAL